MKPTIADLRTLAGLPATIAKNLQVELFEKNGVPTPKSEVLTEDTVLKEEDWGEFVILKPTNALRGWGGHGITLMRTAKVRFLPEAAYPEKHPGRFGPMMVQRYIDTGPHSQDYRVVTMFGEPLYALKRRQLTPLPDLSEPGIDETQQGVTTNSISGEREVGLCYEEDVLAFAKTMYKAARDVAFQGCDVRREAGTGKLYALELNSSGFTWNFSSPRAKKVPKFDGIKREDQFGAFEIMANALISRVRADGLLRY